MADAFYVADGDDLVSTEHTRGPWSPDHQHGGPPAALLGREIERCDGNEDARVGRITVEILGPVPIAPLRASARVVRPGRSVELLEGTLAGPDGDVMRARAWRLREGPVELPDDLPDHPPPPGPAEGVASDYRAAGPGWHAAMEMSFVSGTAFSEPGPATAWMRPRIPLVAGEETSPLARVLLAADAGNGISSVLDWKRFLFINTDLTVHLARMPAGDWVGLDSVTYPAPDGVGLSDTALFDERGRIGRAAQTLLVRAR